MHQMNNESRALRFSGGENAAAAKARCMYADRLTKDDYKELIMCNSVGEAASYLNTKRRYTYALKNERAISGMHREQIEYMLEKRKYDDYVKLSSYLMGSGDYIRYFFSARREVSLLVRAVSSLGVWESDDYYYKIMSDFDKESDIDITSLFEAKTYDGILNVHLEAELWNHLCGVIFERVKKLPSKREREEANTIFKSYIDAKNISAIYRFRNYSECDESYIWNSLIKYGSISEKNLKCLFSKDAASHSESVKTLEKLISDGYDAEASICESKCRKYLRYSAHPAIVVLSYLYLLETELANIIKIVEGIRYSLAKEQIEAMISEE